MPIEPPFSPGPYDRPLLRHDSFESFQGYNADTHFGRQVAHIQGPRRVSQTRYARPVVRVPSPGPDYPPLARPAACALLQPAFVPLPHRTYRDVLADPQVSQMAHPVRHVARWDAAASRQPSAQALHDGDAEALVSADEEDLTASQEFGEARGIEVSLALHESCTHASGVAKSIRKAARNLMRAGMSAPDWRVALASISAYLDVCQHTGVLLRPGQRTSAYVASVIERARLYLELDPAHIKAYALSDPNNCHGYLDREDGTGPGVHTREVLAVVWRCINGYTDPQDPSRSEKTREMLRQVFVRTVADFVGPNGKILCPHGQIGELMQLVQGYHEGVNLALGFVPTPANLMLYFSFKFRRINEADGTPTAGALNKLAKSMLREAQRVWRGTRDAHANRVAFAEQIRAYYAITYDYAWVVPNWPPSATSP